MSSNEEFPGSDTLHPFRIRPELAQLVARYIAANSILELLVSGSFAAIIRDDGAITHATLHHIRNLSDRVAILENVVRALDDGHHLKDPLSKLLPEIRHCVKFRNMLAHGIYYFDGQSDQVIVCSWMTSSTRKTTQTPIDEKAVSAELDRHASLNREMLALGFNILPYMHLKMAPSK